MTWILGASELGKPHHFQETEAVEASGGVSEGVSE